MALDTQAQHNYSIPSDLPSGIFRTYDIRGIVEEELTDNVVYAIGRAIGSEAVARGESEILLARDARLSGPSLCAAMQQGLLDSGLNITFLGIIPSPVLYFATNVMPIHSGVVVTASHNPSEYNGIKIVLQGKTLKSEDIVALYDRIKAEDFAVGSGTVTEHDIVPTYMDDICQRIQLQRPLKVVLDCGNGVGALTAPDIYRRLGCEVIELFCEVDGRFPNHHPDPTIPKNLQDLIQAVKDNDADVGLALDGDADRLGLITNKGEIIWPDRQMMLFSQDVLSRKPGGEIVFDVKSSNLLDKVIREAGGKPMMWKTGHSILKAKMLDDDAVLAGEMSGHVFFRENWYGFDDGAYVGARLLEILARGTKTCSEIFAGLPDAVNTPELKLYLDEVQKHAFVERLAKEGNFPDATLIDIDGVRLDFGFGWGLVRASNTTPCLTLRFEADTENNLKVIQKVIGDEILRLDPSLELPY